MPRIIVGLGNPGPEYEGTRHNVGFAVVDALARRLRTAGWRRGFRSLWTEGAWRGQPVLLLKPQTYMNLSGEAVEQACRALRAEPAEVLVVYDDLDLPPGHLRLRPGGRAGGHRGVASIIEALGRDDFPRLRVGIGRPPAGVDAAEYVLAPFTAEEQALMAAAVQRAAEAVLAVLSTGLDRAMSRYNGPTPWPPATPGDGAESAGRRGSDAHRGDGPGPGDPAVDGGGGRTT
ncbi:aminoacyl-tRNA hydrolase [Thermaerobacter litoralis]